MARVKLEEAEAMVGSGHSSNWFSIEQDRGVRRVRILIDKVDDVDVYAVHRIQLGNRDRWISCLRHKPDDPMSDCPLCAMGNRASPRVFLQMVDVEDGQIYIWDRGLNIVQKLRGIEKRITGPLYQTVIEIERNGRKGSQTTTYEFYPNNKADTQVTLQSLPPKVDLEAASIILSENASAMNTYLATGDFPGWGVNKVDNQNVPVVPRGSTPGNSSFVRQGGVAPSEAPSNPNPDSFRPRDTGVAKQAASGKEDDEEIPTPINRHPRQW